MRRLAARLVAAWLVCVTVATAAQRASAQQGTQLYLTRGTFPMWNDRIKEDYLRLPWGGQIRVKITFDDQQWLLVPGDVELVSTNPQVLKVPPTLEMPDGAAIELHEPAGPTPVTITATARTAAGVNLQASLAVTRSSALRRWRCCPSATSTRRGSRSR